jgi:hypothetical protein
MSCLTSFVALPFKIAGTAALALGLLLVVSGYRIRHPGFCALGAACGVVGMLMGWVWWWVGAGTAIAGLVGYQRYRRLPR